MPARFAGYQTNLSPVSQGQVSEIKWGNFNMKLYRFAETLILILNGKDAYDIYTTLKI